MVNSEQLKQLHIGPEWVDALNETFQRFDISTPLRQAAFIGQCGHECGNFKVLQENLNYRAEALQKLWPKRFDAAKAQACARNPKAIATAVYSNRMGNRDEASGDAWRFIGRGCIQLTGASSYFHAGKALGVDFWANPDLVATPQYAALSAGWFWDKNRLNAYADKNDMQGLTKKINGGTHGIEDRIARTQLALDTLMA